MSDVAWGLEAVEPAPSVVTIGNFDGVHRGHRVLLHRAVGAASDGDARAVAVTFDPHPAAVLRPGSEPLALQPVEDRVAALRDAGVDLVVVLPFTRELASLQPEAFVEQVLVERLRCVRVVVGTSFRFGHKAAGDVVTLVEAGERHGFETEAVTLLDLDGEAISSSAVRAHVTQGDVAWAARAIGRPFRLRGEVVPGDGRGRTIGIPTANLAVPEWLVVPADGVYAGHARVDDRWYVAVTNVGTRPTFDGRSRSIEAHLLDVTPELYGRELTVTFEARVRDERRFSGPDELVAQIHADIARARELVGEAQPN